jgi:predicted kinase
VLMPVAHLPRGLQGSGKTTLAARIAATTGAVHVRLDDHRRKMWPDCPPSWDPYHGRGLLVQESYEQEAAALLAAGRDVVLDRTNLAAEGIRRLERLAPNLRLVIYDLRRVPLADCIRRDADRPPAQRIGADSIRQLAHRWL